MSNFYIRFFKDADLKTKITYLAGSRPYYLNATMIEEEVKDRRIVKVLRKYLDMNLEAGKLSEFVSDDFEALGELLFDLIFAADSNLTVEFKAWYSEAIKNTKSEESYNVFLEFDWIKELDDLAILPWEYIYYRPKEKGYIVEAPFLAAANKKINFYRKIPFKFLEASDPQFLKINKKLNILLIISDPLGEFEIRKRAQLCQLFKDLSVSYPPDILEINYLYQPNKDEFLSELKNGQNAQSKSLSTEQEKVEQELGDKIGKHYKGFAPDIIHFAGHGLVRDKKGILILTERNDQQLKIDPKEIDDVSFATCIKDSDLKPKLMFIQACNGCRIADYQDKSGVAIRLLETKIPYVIAMQNPIQEDNANSFTKIFYDNFISGKDIGSCVTAARYGLGNGGKFNQKAFGSPVLLTYSDFPLKFIISDDQTEITEEGVEEIIKFCDTPGCPYYKDEVHYKPLDNLCSSCCNKLAVKKKGKPGEVFKARISEMENTGQLSNRDNKSADMQTSDEDKRKNRGPISRNNDDDISGRPLNKWFP